VLKHVRSKRFPGVAVYSHEKGGVQTYWLEITPARTSETSSQRDSIDTDELRDSAGPVSASFASSKCDSKTIRLIQWNEDVLLRLLKQIVARRTAYPLSASEAIKPNEGRFMGVRDSLNANDDVKEIISLPRFKASKVKVADPDTVELDQEVVNQLRQYLTAVAEMYRNHEFHNFEHASHVAMSVVKLLSRIVDPCEASSGTTEASAQHDRTFGISSDPLTQFSCVLAALVHDVDHPGVPNEQLVREQNELATTFHSSQAERHSLSTAWNMLFEKKYTMLRNTTYETDAELLRFRQVLVNSVLATDLFDLELREDRKLRWDRAFAATASRLTSSEMLNRRATIVVDCLLQASDIAHTMQHWFIYRKWNERLFFECYDAYLEGRADHRKNPADDWYEGELRFYDFNVIPLAHKLKECGVFGVAAEEYLSYAIRNRSDWEKRGRELVREMVDRVNQKDGRLEA
jgi:3'5'-cyclic nucleotide phosphodiesterase